MRRKILACGLGGGLDIVNASLVYFAAKAQDREVELGSIRPAPISSLDGHCPISESSAWVDRRSKVNFEPGKGPKRYAEPRVADIIDDKVLFISRYSKGYPKKKDTFPLCQALWQFYSREDLTDMFFVDGGGDSLILTPDDAVDLSETSDPFEGGDAMALEAMTDMPDAYLVVISAGLDIDDDAFRRNKDMLSGKGAYYGRINLATGVHDGYGLRSILRFDDGFLERYFDLAEKLLVLEESHLKDPERIMSHTAVVTYHALKGNYGLQRTFVPWEPTTDGEKGVEVTPDHAWMYFFNAGKVHPAKLHLRNGR